EANALVYLDEKFPRYFKSPAAKQIIDTHNLPTDLKAGTCTNSDASDAIGNVLGISSLLLSPTGLDIIPDALSVIYFYATDNDLEFGLSAISVVTPANINALKRGLSGASDAVAAINKGEELMKEGV